MSNTIESEDISFGKLYEDYYAVPNYQREYVWGKAQIELLLNDIYTEFEGSENLQQELKSEYFVGSIVVCPQNGNSQIYDLIDGQQRTTTTYILLCAIRDRLTELAQIPMADLMSKISSTSTNMDGEEVHRYRLDLQYEDSRDILIELANTKLQIEKAPSDTLSIKNIKGAYRIIKGFLQEQFGDDPARLKRFYAYFINKVKIIRIKTGSVAHALKIFETINDRGKALDAMDLLKNLMFMSASPKEYDKLKSLWKELTDLLYSENEKPLRFLRYFIFASYDVDLLREDEIYTWLSKNADLCGYKADPKGFVNKLLSAAKAHINFINSNDASGKFNRYIDNISYLSGSARQHFILLLAGRHMADEPFNLLAKNIESLLFSYIITRESTKEFERLFAKWATELRKLNSTQEVQAFIDKHFKPAKNQLSPRFTASINLLRFDSIQFYRLRYIIGKLAQYVNEKAFGDQGNNGQLSTFINKFVDIEHILSQTLTKENVEEFDNREGVQVLEKIAEARSFVQRLGNLTLVEKTLNTSLGNKPFSQKRPVYQRSQFLLTNSIYDNSKVGVASSFDKAISLLISFDLWDREALIKRQSMITSLAHLVWDMPENTQ